MTIMQCCLCDGGDGCLMLLHGQKMSMVRQWCIAGYFFVLSKAKIETAKLLCAIGSTPPFLAVQMS